jgi:hypothetical protein
MLVNLTPDRKLREGGFPLRSSYNLTMKSKAAVPVAKVLKQSRIYITKFHCMKITDLWI